MKKDTRVDEFDLPSSKDTKILRVLYPRLSSRLFYFIVKESSTVPTIRRSALGVQGITGCSAAFVKKLSTFPRKM